MPSPTVETDGSISATIDANDAIVTTHWAQVDAFDAASDKPLQVTRNWEGQTIQFWCYVTQDLVDAYNAGNLAVGDYVTVLFVDGDRDQPLATQKIYQSW